MSAANLPRTRSFVDALSSSADSVDNDGWSLSGASSFWSSSSSSSSKASLQDERVWRRIVADKAHQPSRVRVNTLDLEVTVKALRVAFSNPREYALDAVYGLKELEGMLPRCKVANVTAGILAAFEDLAATLPMDYVHGMAPHLLAMHALTHEAMLTIQRRAHESKSLADAPYIQRRRAQEVYDRVSRGLADDIL